MEPFNTKRTRIIGLRLTGEEYQKIEKACRSTTCRKLSEYVRRILFHKPITVLQRNASLDDVVAELIPLRTELQRVLAHCENTRQRILILSYANGLEHTLNILEKEQQQLTQIVFQIQQSFDQIADQWLQ